MGINRPRAASAPSPPATPTATTPPPPPFVRAITRAAAAIDAALDAVRVARAMGIVRETQGHCHQVREAEQAMDEQAARLVRSGRKMRELKTGRGYWPLERGGHEVEGWEGMVKEAGERLEAQAVRFARLVGWMPRMHGAQRAVLREVVLWEGEEAEKEREKEAKREREEDVRKWVETQRKYFLPL